MGGRSKLGELLIRAGRIGAHQLAAALGEQKRWGSRLGTILVRMGFLDEETLIRTLAVQLGLPMARIRGRRIPAEAISLVPAELAEKHRCLPLLVRSESGAPVLFLAMEDPADLASLDDLSFRTGVEIRPVLAAPSEIEEGLDRHYRFASPDAVSEPVDLAGPEGGEGEPELRVVEDLGPPPAAPGERPAAERREPAAAAPAPNAAAVSQDAILRALTQLLVEKGILTREELIRRVGTLSGKGGDAVS